MSMMTLTSA